jgi:hypothetical protein
VNDRKLKAAATALLKKMLPRDQFDDVLGQYMELPDWHDVERLMEALNMDLGPKGLRRRIKAATPTRKAQG